MRLTQGRNGLKAEDWRAVLDEHDHVGHRVTLRITPDPDDGGLVGSVWCDDHNVDVED